MSAARQSRASFPSRPWLLPAAVSVIALAFLIHALALAQTQNWQQVDDAYITYRYVQQWVVGHGLVFNPGDPVEGYSNFLWAVLLVPAAAIGLDLVQVSRLLGLTCSLGTLLLTQRLGERLTGAPWLGILAAGVLALDGSFARWAIDGLETPLFTFLLTLAVWLEVVGPTRPRQWTPVSWSGIALGLAALTRPEGWLCCVLVVLYRLGAAVRRSQGFGVGPGPAGLILEDRQRSLGDPHFWRELLSLIGSFGLLVGPHLLWRHATYGDWLPNTAYVKVQPGFVATVRGLRYTVEFLLQRGGLLLCLPVARILGRSARADNQPVAAYPLRFPLLIATVFGLYVVGVGGDWMGRARFFVPVLPLLALLWVEAVARGMGGARGATGYPRRRSTAMLLMAGGLSLLYTSTWHGERPYLLKSGLESLERREIADWLRQNAPRDATLLTEEIGQIPYWTGLHTYDVYGLIDRHIARTAPWDLDSAPGHQRHDLNYSLSLGPDYLVMANFRPTWERHIGATPDQVRFPLLRAYVPIPLDLPEGRLEVYAREHPHGP